jgi:hypothetical protein
MEKATPANVSPTLPYRIRAQERRAKAIELRRAGLSFAAIGAELGVSKQTAHKLVQNELKDLSTAIREQADELRAEEADRLNAAAAAIWPAVLKGQLRAQEVFIKNRARYADLLGLDLAPHREPPQAPQILILDAPWERTPEAPGAVVDGEAVELPALPHPRAQNGLGGATPTDDTPGVPAPA